MYKSCVRGPPKSSWNQARLDRPKGDVWPARGIDTNSDLVMVKTKQFKDSILTFFTGCLCTSHLLLGAVGGRLLTLVIHLPVSNVAPVSFPLYQPLFLILCGAPKCYCPSLAAHHHQSWVPAHRGIQPHPMPQGGFPALAAEGPWDAVTGWEGCWGTRPSLPAGPKTPTWHSTLQ